jgi:hypothetical protein
MVEEFVNSPEMHRLLADIEAQPPSKKVKTGCTNILSESDKSLIRSSINVIVQLLEIYGFDSYQYSTLPTATHWLACAEKTSSSGAIPFLKYKLAAFYSSIRTLWFDDVQDLPNKPGDFVDQSHILLGGRAYTFINGMRRHNLSRFETFCVSVLNVKKGFDRPGVDFIHTAEVDTFTDLTTESVFPSGEFILPWVGEAEAKEKPIYDKSFLDWDLLSKELDRTVDEIYSGYTYTDEDRYRMFFPSTSANYINNRGEGGALGFIMNHPTLLQGLKYKDSRIDISYTGGYDVENGKDIAHWNLVADTLQEHWNELYNRMMELAMSETPHAIPLGLAEALKARIITKGPPLLNTVLKPVQMFVWGVMKNHPAFKLVGEWIQTSYLTSRLGSRLQDDQYYLSVDYKNATNEMHSRVSERIANRISDVIELSENERELFVRALTKHIMVHPDDENVTKEQKKGQLMGSIVSFPVLCIANAAILRLSKEYDSLRELTLTQSGIIVNGDDGLLKGSKNLKNIWERVAKHGGFSPSVGKVYQSRKFFNINSTTYNYSNDPVDSYQSELPDGRLKTRPIHFYLVPYVNMGLFLDKERSAGADTNSNVSVSSIGERAHELMRTCPVDLKTMVLDRYIRRHKALLSSLNIPWFIPSHLGGAGLPVGTEERHQPNPLQLRIATKFHIMRTQHDIRVPSLRPTDVWRTWKIALKKVPVDQFDPLDIILASTRLLRLGHLGLDEGQQYAFNIKTYSVSSIRNLMVLETLFTSEFDDLFDSKKIRRERKLAGKFDDQGRSLLEVKKSTIERNFYRKLQNLNQFVAADTLLGKLEDIQSFTVGSLPGPPVDTDSVHFILGDHPFYPVDLEAIISPDIDLPSESLDEM